MRKLNYLPLTLLVAVAVTFLGERYAIASLPHSLAHNSGTETRRDRQQLVRGDLNEKKPARDDIPRGLRVQIPWESLYEQKKPPREDPPASSRDGFCPIAPAGLDKPSIIWSDRPLFIWQGRIGKIEVRPQDSQQVLWSQKLRETERSTIYEGEPLQPGQVYDQMIFDRRDRPVFRVRFQVIEKEERDRIASI